MPSLGTQHFRCITTNAVISFNAKGVAASSPGLARTRPSGLPWVKEESENYLEGVASIARHGRNAFSVVIAHINRPRVVEMFARAHPGLEDITPAR